MSDAFCLLHGYEFMASVSGDPVADCRVCDLATDIAAARVEALQAEVERLREEVEKAGREANIARYGEPDFAWSIHKAAMADLAAEAARLRADLAVAREALAFYSCKDGCNDCSENERDLIGCGWAARAALARITQEAPE